MLRLRRAIAFINNTLAMPIPFPYFHALNLILFINYVAFSVALTAIPVHFSPVLLLVILVIFTGMREVSCALSNPFGEDDVEPTEAPDLSVKPIDGISDEQALRIREAVQAAKRRRRQEGQGNQK